MAIVIKKRVSLDYLGEEYKTAYLIFRSIPAIEYDDVVEELKKPRTTQKESLEFLIDLLKKYFVTGEFPDDNGTLAPVSADDIGQLDPGSIIECFKVFTGQELDPKVSSPLTSSSPTEATLPSNS